MFTLRFLSRFGFMAFAFIVAASAAVVLARVLKRPALKALLLLLISFYGLC